MYLCIKEKQIILHNIIIQHQLTSKEMDIKKTDVLVVLVLTTLIACFRVGTAKTQLSFDGGEYLCGRFTYMTIINAVLI